MTTAKDIDTVTEVCRVHLPFVNELTPAFGLGSSVTGVYTVSRNLFRFQTEALCVVHKQISLHG